jgi:4-hydroxythreonine-4-phosphate dehydrogenase
MAPAFPAAGRTTVGGRQQVGGVPLEQTEHWRRERRSDDADVARLLERAGLRAARLGLDDIRRAARLEDVLWARAAGHDAIVCDAETEADLAAIAAAAAKTDRATVWAGSAGLATYLPQASGLTARSRRSPGIVVPVARGPILFVVGSPASISRAQAEALAAEPGVVRVAVDDAAGLEAAIASGADVIVQPTASRIAARLAPVAARASGLVVTGGATARALLSALGVQRLRLVDEVERGVPRSVAPLAVPLPVVTKAGAFGDRLTLVRSRAALRRL